MESIFIVILKNSYLAVCYIQCKTLLLALRHSVHYVGQQEKKELCCPQTLALLVLSLQTWTELHTGSPGSPACRWQIV